MTSSPMFGDTDPELLARRAASFGSQAATYAEARPDYPRDAVGWALDPVADRTPLRVLDLGAGTGKLTGVLADRLAAHPGSELVAVEPDPAMLAELRRLLPDVRALAGSAERIPLPDGSVDAVLVGQALHWFDLDQAMPEIARVLASGGVLAGLWNLDDDRAPWVRGLKDVARSTVSFSHWRPVDIPLHGSDFPAVERANFRHAQRRTAESMTATIGTHSHVLTLPEPERGALLRRVTDYLRATPETADGEFELPIVTVVVRVQRATRRP